MATLAKSQRATILEAIKAGQMPLDTALAFADKELSDVLKSVKAKKLSLDAAIADAQSSARGFSKALAENLKLFDADTIGAVEHFAAGQLADQLDTAQDVRIVFYVTPSTGKARSVSAQVVKAKTDKDNSDDSEE